MRGVGSSLGDKGSRRPRGMDAETDIDVDGEPNQLGRRDCSGFEEDNETWLNAETAEGVRYRQAEWDWGEDWGGRAGSTMRTVRDV